MKSASIVIGSVHALVCVLVTAWSLQRFAGLIEGYLSIDYSFTFELCMVIGQVVFQWLVLARASWKDRLRYVPIVLSISLMGSVLLMPLLAWAAVHAVQPLTALAWFFSVVLVMFLTHRHWIGRVGLPWYLTWTWVLYRLLLLPVII